MAGGRSRDRIGRPAPAAGSRSRGAARGVSRAAPRTQHGRLLRGLVRVVRVLGGRGGIAGVELFLLQLAPGAVDGLLDSRRAAPVMLREFSKLAGGVLVQPDRKRARHALMIPVL